jgi:hypothetical protein
MTTATATPMGAVLQLAVGTGRPRGDPLGLWCSVPASPTKAVRLAAATSHPGTVWRVCLPADAAAADRLLTQAETSLTEAQLALSTIEDPMRAVVARHAGAPFAGLQTTAGGQLQLERLLAELTDDQDSDGVVAFAPGRLSWLWRQIVAEATAFLARLDEATADEGWVETEQSGRVLAVTELNWRGTRTVWRTQLSADHGALHQRALGLVFASRLALVRTFLTALRVATLLGALFNPGGGLLAFPAALQFVAQFLAERRTSPGRT